MGSMNQIWRTDVALHKQVQVTLGQLTSLRHDPSWGLRSEPNIIL